MLGIGHGFGHGKRMTDPEKICPIILSGGGGTRLWPMSNAARPKQFLAITGTQTLFQQTLQRIEGSGFAAPIIVANHSHSDIVVEQAFAAGIALGRIILEPCGRNTAPAIALAALTLPRDALMLVLPSDHLVQDLPAFHAAISTGAALATDNWLVTFGIAPTAPETGFGYIRRGRMISDTGKGSAAQVGATPGYAVDRFIEKPTADVAQSMLDEGGYDWNGGIFLFRAGAFLDALNLHAPDIVAASQAARDNAAQDGIVMAPQHDDFAAIRSDSIDYAVMEKADRVAVVPVSMGWSDVGSWDAIHALGPQDAAGNVSGENGLAIDASNNLLVSDGPRISVLGVDGLAVIVSNGEVMILPRRRSQDVRILAAARDTHGQQKP
jgi:mannose-1-phosphate guanylyltransferase